MSLSRIAELEALADNLTRENNELRNQLRRTSLRPPSFSELPSPIPDIGNPEPEVLRLLNREVP